MNTFADDIRTVKGNIPRLEWAVTHRDTLADPIGFVTGGAPAWEPISLGIVSLLADIRRETDELGAQLRGELGHAWHRSPALSDALDRLATAWDARQEAAGASLTAEQARRRVSVWVGRSRRLLGETTAPYRLRWPDGSAVTCPVIEYRLTNSTPQPCECGGELWAHRDDEGIPREIRCKPFPRDHAWQAGPGWLRLGALLGENT
jgi:hypothetical protein